MYNATLIYELDSDKRIPVKTGSLKLIDSETMSADKPALLMNKYKRQILSLLNDNKEYIRQHPDNKGRFLIEYVKDSEFREELPVVYKTNKYRPILTKTVPVALENLQKDHIHIEPSEIERARRLLLSSKYKRFLISVLRDETFNPTMEYKMKVTKHEYNKARSIGITGFIKNGQYGLTIREALVYLYKANRLGSMRVLVEDSLELWKKNLETLEDEDLYYYARSLRVLIDDYYANINYKNKTVTNLKAHEENLARHEDMTIVTDVKHYEPIKEGKLIKIKLPKAA